MDARPFGFTLSDITNTPLKQKTSDPGSKHDTHRSTLGSPSKRTPNRRNSKNHISYIRSAQSSLFNDENKEQFRSTRFADEKDFDESRSYVFEPLASQDYSPDLGDGGRIVDMQLKAILKRQNLRVSAADWTTSAKGRTEETRHPPSRQQATVQFPRSPGCFSNRRSSGYSSCWASPVDLGDHGAIVDDELRQKLVRQHRIAQKVSSNSFDLSGISCVCPFGSMCCDCISFEKGTVSSLHQERKDRPTASGKRLGPEITQQDEMPGSSADPQCQSRATKAKCSASLASAAKTGAPRLIETGAAGRDAADRPSAYCGIRDNVFIRLDAAGGSGSARKATARSHTSPAPSSPGDRRGCAVRGCRRARSTEAGSRARLAAPWREIWRRYRRPHRRAGRRDEPRVQRV